MRREDQRGGNGSVPGTRRKAVPIAMATGPAEYTAGQRELLVIDLNVRRKLSVGKPDVEHSGQKNLRSMFDTISTLESILN